MGPGEPRELHDDEGRDLTYPAQRQKIAPQRIGVADLGVRLNREPGGQPAIELVVERAIGEHSDAVRQEHGGVVAAWMVETFVAESDALAPA